MTPMQLVFALIDVYCLFCVVRNIYNSAQRWQAFGLAVVCFCVPCVLGFGAAWLFESGLRQIGQAITISAPIAAAFGSELPPSRKRAAS